MGITLICDAQSLAGVRGGWEALAMNAGSPMLDHDWFASCAEAFYQPGQLRVVIAGEGGAITGIAPMALEATPTGDRLALLGATRLYEPNGWLFRSTESARELATEVVRLGYPTLLQRIPVESALHSVFPTILGHRATMVTRSTAPSYAVETSGGWDAYYAGLSSRITENLPRVRRRAERAFGRVEFVQTEPRACEVDTLFAALVAVEGSGWKGRRHSALRDRPELCDFFRRYAHRAADRGRLRVSTLKFGHEIAAMELAVEAYGRMWQLKIGYNEQVSEFYPGLHLTESSIRATFERGLSAYEFLGSAEPWEARWRPVHRRYNLLMLYPLNARGIVAGCRDLAGLVWRRTSRALHPPTAAAALEAEA